MILKKHFLNIQKLCLYTLNYEILKMCRTNNIINLIFNYTFSF